jgi:molybdate transport system substrate-binding protein
MLAKSLGAHRVRSIACLGQSSGASRGRGFFEIGARTGSRPTAFTSPGLWRVIRRRPAQRNKAVVISQGEDAMGTCAHAAIAGIFGAMVNLGATQAAEITVLTGQGVASAVRDLAPAFERASGHKVVVSFESAPALMRKIDANAPADLVTQTPEVIDDLIRKGKVAAGAKVVFARAGIGVAVKAGAPRPDIGSAEAFKRAMLAAKSVAYSKVGASGLYVAKLMDRLGIAEEMRPKTKLVEGVPVAELVAKGEAEIGMQQINVILPVAGVEYVGPLPGELQDYVVFAAGLLAVAKEPEAAKAMMNFISAPAAEPLIRKSGMEPAVR